MELTFAEQTNAFVLSLPLGAALGVLYGIFRLLRCTLLTGRAAAVALDIIFMLIWAWAAFLFSLGYLMGYVRLYVFIGSFLGFLIYRLTLGRLLVRVYQPLMKTAGAVLQKIAIKLKFFAKYLLKTAYNLLYNISRKKECLMQKRKRKRERLLHQRKSYELDKTENKKGKAGKGSERRGGGGRSQRSGGA